VALVHLVVRLRLGGFALLDTQFVTDHLARFGAIEVSRLEYRRLLAEAIDLPAVFRAEISAEELRAEIARLKAAR
jgi:leucyl/phenylalanyl-tRNA--protein transferase